MQDGSAVKFSVEGRIAWVSLNRPEKKNAINRAMRKEVQEAFTEIKHNPDIWIGIVTGEGDVFCAGKDLLEKLPEDDGQVMSNDELYIFLRNIHKPMICALNGPCLAQGGGFALNSDIVVMAENASIGWPQPKRGISSVSGPTLLPHAMPWTAAMGYLMRGKFIPADECVRFGLANEVVAAADLRAAAKRWAEEIMECAPMAVRAIKEAARRGLEIGFEDRVYLARDVANRVFLTNDSKEGVAAFREKRKPEWTGQ